MDAERVSLLCRSLHALTRAHPDTQWLGVWGGNPELAPPGLVGVLASAPTATRTQSESAAFPAARDWLAILDDVKAPQLGIILRTSPAGPPSNDEASELARRFLRGLWVADETSTGMPVPPGSGMVPLGDYRAFDAPDLVRLLDAAVPWTPLIASQAAASLAAARLW
jgi:hypothetical protein